ncbi:MAG: type II secretion system minor pseudopilin GspK [Reinekea sp.]
MRSFKAINKHQSGFVLLQVMLVFSILIVIVAQLQYKQRVHIERVRQSLFLSQAQSYVDGAVSLAQSGLTADRKVRGGDHLREIWNRPFSAPMTDDGTWTLYLSLDDLQGRFNINWLAMTSSNRQGAQKAFSKLLSLLSADSEIATELYNWFDADSGIDYDYAELDPSYAPSFHEMADISELMLLNAVDRDQYELIFPFLSALPADSKLNINTAPEEVIASIADFISIDDAQAAVSIRDDHFNEVTFEGGFASLDEFKNMTVFNNNKNKDTYLPLTELTLDSEWFDLYASVKNEDLEFQQRDVIYRNSAGETTITLVDRAVTDSNPIPHDPEKSIPASETQNSESAQGSQGPGVQSGNGQSNGGDRE